MGVISNGTSPLVDFIEEADENLMDVEHIPQHELEQNNNANNRINVQERRCARKIKVRPPVKPVNFTTCTKHTGAKKYRRYVNTLQLLELVDADDCEGEISIHDFMSKGISAFSEILERPENVKLWNDFVNCSEDEQTEQLIKHTVSSSANKGKKSAVAEDTHEPSADLPNCDDSDECFSKIGTRFRALLKRRNVHLGALAYMEDDVISFFVEWPEAVYILKLANSYERLMLHGLCQYLNLISESYNAAGERQTKVENPRKFFKPPPVLLTQYIEQHFKKPRV